MYERWRVSHAAFVVRFAKFGAGVSGYLLYFHLRFHGQLVCAASVGRVYYRVAVTSIVGCFKTQQTVRDRLQRPVFQKCHKTQPLAAIASSSTYHRHYADDFYRHRSDEWLDVYLGFFLGVSLDRESPFGNGVCRDSPAYPLQRSFSLRQTQQSLVRFESVVIISIMLPVFGL